MKKQINPSIKAHLIRGAFYLLLLIAVCAIPFALAQRNATKRPVTVRPPAVKPYFSSVTQSRSPLGPRTKRLLHSLLPNSVYMIDDGTSENGVGFGNGSQNFEALWFNQFEVISGQTMISTVSIAWGTPLFPDPSNNGTPVTIAIWSDPNGDGNPSDAVLLGSVAGTIQNEGTDTFVDYTFSPPVDVSAFTSFFVGDMTPMNNGPEHFYQGIDQDSTLHRQSWVAGNSDGSPVDLNMPGNNDTVGLIDDFGLPGNWLVRADTGAQVSPTPTATATATGTPSSCSWGAGADMPVAGIRFSGVFFPANGKFYAMGGRDLQTGGTEFTNPFEYDPVANSWTTKAATYPDPLVGNTECAVANDSGTDYIYCVGGSQSSTATETGRVFRYDPVADVITTVATDWPPGDASTLPGGITVFNNTIYILGGFDVLNNVSTDQIWAFTPSPAGWVQKNTVLPVALGYIPTCTIGSLIYTGGGFDAATATDQTNSFVYDPVADSISTIASIPRPSSDTRGLNFCNQFYVVGGGGFPDYFNEVDIYDPVSDTWSVGQPFVTARRNAANDTDGTNNIWLAGGLDANLGSLASTEIFNCPVSPCGTASPTPTATATATVTVSATPTATVTPSASPSCTPITPIVIEGSIDLSDPTQVDHLNRSGIPQTCPATTSCEVAGDQLLHHYDSYTFTNTSGSSQCVTIDTNSACSGVRFIFTAAYLGSFDPNNICTNWIGDSGSNPDPDQAFQVEVPDGQTLIVVVSNFTANGTCPAYTLTVGGLCGAFTPSPTPRMTPTPRVAPTPRPRPTPAPRP